MAPSDIYLVHSEYLSPVAPKSIAMNKATHFKCAESLAAAGAIIVHDEHRESNAKVDAALASSIDGRVRKRRTFEITPSGRTLALSVARAASIDVAYITEQYSKGMAESRAMTTEKMEDEEKDDPVKRLFNFGQRRQKRPSFIPSPILARQPSSQEDSSVISVDNTPEKKSFSLEKFACSQFACSQLVSTDTALLSGRIDEQEDEEEHDELEDVFGSVDRGIVGGSLDDLEEKFWLDGGGRLVVLVDVREERAFAKERFPDRIPVKYVSLPIGDFGFGWDTSKRGPLLIQDNQNTNMQVFPLFLERKTNSDLMSSLVDGRYEEQRSRLLRFAGQPVYLFEGPGFSLNAKDEYSDNNKKAEEEDWEEGEEGDEEDEEDQKKKAMQRARLFGGRRGYYFGNRKKFGRNSNDYGSVAARNKGVLSSFTSALLKSGMSVVKSKDESHTIRILTSMYDKLNNNIVSFVGDRAKTHLVLESMPGLKLWYSRGTLRKKVLEGEIADGVTLPNLVELISEAKKSSDVSSVQTQLARQLFCVSGVGEEAAWALAQLFSSHHELGKALMDNSDTGLRDLDKKRTGTRKTPLTVKSIQALRQFYFG